MADGILKEQRYCLELGRLCNHQWSTCGLRSLLLHANQAVYARVQVNAWLVFCVTSTENDKPDGLLINSQMSHTYDRLH